MPRKGSSLCYAEDKERYEKELEAMPAWKKAKLSHKGTKKAKKGRSTKARMTQDPAPVSTCLLPFWKPHKVSHPQVPCEVIRPLQQGCLLSRRMVLQAEIYLADNVTQFETESLGALMTAPIFVRNCPGRV